MKQLSIFFICLSLTTQAFALEELMKNFRGVRSLGMGGIVTTTGLYEEALFGNPATQLEDPTWKLTLFSAIGEVNDHFLSDYKKIKDIQGAEGGTIVQKIADSGIAGRNQHVRGSLILPGFYHPTLFSENTGFAIALMMNTQANVILRATAAAESQTVADIGPAVSLGHKFMDGRLNIGFNARFLYRVAADRTLQAVNFLTGQKITASTVGAQGAGIDGDVGAYYKIPKKSKRVKQIAFGLAMHNVAASKYQTAMTDQISSITAAPPANDRTFSMGIRTDFHPLWFFKDTLAAVEMHDIGPTQKMASLWKKIHFGGETKPLSFLSLRAGVNQGYFCGGIGFDFPLLKIDFATYGEELGSNTGQMEDRRYALRVAFEI